MLIVHSGTLVSLDLPNTLSMMTHVANNYRPPPMLKPVVASGHVMPGHAVIAAAGHHVITPGHPVSIIQTLAQPVLQSVPQQLPIIVKPDFQVPLHHQIIMKAAPVPGGTTELARCGMAVKHEAVSIAEIASLQLQQFVKQELQQSQPTVRLNTAFHFTVLSMPRPYPNIYMQFK